MFNVWMTIQLDPILARLLMDEIDGSGKPELDILAEAIRQFFRNC